MNFSKALELIKSGKKLKRKNWNGVNMFVYFVSEGKYQAKSNCIKGVYENDLVPYSAYLAFRTSSGEIVPWCASQSDLLASDWCEA